MNFNAPTFPNVPSVTVSATNEPYFNGASTTREVIIEFNVSSHGVIISIWIVIRN